MSLKWRHQAGARNPDLQVLCETNLDGYYVIQIAGVYEVARRVDAVGQAVECAYVRIATDVTLTHRPSRIMPVYLQWAQTRFLMKLFRTSNIDIINDCRSSFIFLLLSEMIEIRNAKFKGRFNMCNSLRYYFGL